MYKKIITSLLITSSILHAQQELKDERFQLLAKNIDTKQNIITANGDVVIFSPTYYLSANKIIFNKENETFELFGNVLIIKDNSIQTQSDYAFVDLKEDLFNQNPMFLYEDSNKIWVNSKSSKKEKENIELDSTIISSCDCIDPAWSIRASSADYNTEKKWINAYNPRLYIKDVPVLYSPYFGFPTDKSRRSGLLLPTLGFSSDEGVYYSQPIYFAPAQNYDLEIIPQMRSKRGYGAYSHYRYADSIDSMLKIKTGVFRENDEYKKENDLENETHFGLNIDYRRKNLLFFDDNSTDGLYTNINYLNDVEYITLEDDANNVSTDKKVESKINYFYDNPSYYMGTYSRYYIDTSKKSNRDTLQELPQLHFHSYNKELFLDKLVYSIDTKFINYVRPDGLSADVYEMSLPLSYNKYFFDDFIYLNLENKTTIRKYEYNNFKNENYENGTLLQNRSSISIGSDLIKPYKNYLHTINLNAEYSIPKNLKEDGDLYKITTVKDSTKEEELKAFPIAQESEQIELSLNQSLYNKESLKQIINHKLSQSIIYDDLDKPQLQNLENYIKVNYDYGSAVSKFIYNVEDKQITENTADLSFLYKDFSFGVGYYKSKDTPNSNKEELESYRFNTSYKIAKDYKISYYENHNILDKVKNKQGISFNIDDRCWNFDIKFENEIVPSSSINEDGIDQRIIFLNLTLKSLGGVKQKYKLEDNN